MIINLAGKSDIKPVVEVLDKATLKLLKKDIKQWTYPWPIPLVENEIAQKLVYKVEIENLVIGTFMIKPIRSLNNLLIKENSLYVARIAILPEYQGKNIGVHIISYCWSFSKKHKRDMYLDCWAGNVTLKEFYSKCGLTCLGDFPVDDYYVSVYCFGEEI